MSRSSGVTIDANVFVAAARRIEDHRATSRRFIADLLRRRIPVLCPTIMLPEISAAIVRPTGDEYLGLETSRRVQTIPMLRFVALDQVLAEVATVTAAKHRLRGADAVYVAVAREHGTALVTWDKELLQRGPAVVPTMTRAEWLGKNGG